MAEILLCVILVEVLTRFTPTWVCVTVLIVSLLTAITSVRVARDSWVYDFSFWLSVMILLWNGSKIYHFLFP